MKKAKSVWWQPQGWLTFGSIAVVAIVVAYLIFFVARFIAPRVRSIGKIYNSACVSGGWEDRGLETGDRVVVLPPAGRVPSWRAPDEPVASARAHLTRCRYHRAAAGVPAQAGAR